MDQALAEERQPAIEVRPYGTVEPGTNRFVTGTKPGPGRPKGSRSKLSEQFLADLQAVWSSKGIATIEAAMEQRPADVLKVIASILPRELKVSVAQELSDDELDSQIARLAKEAGLVIEAQVTETAETKEKDPL